MPSVEENEPPRLVLDESSFDFRGMQDAAIETVLDDFNKDLRELRTRHQRDVACPPMWDATECLDGCDLSSFLGRVHDSAVDRDTLLLTYSLLSRCSEWEASPGLAMSVAIDGTAPDVAMSISFALHNALARRGMACMTLRCSGREGLRDVHGTEGDAPIFFFRTGDELTGFWRHLFALEDVPEGSFFALCNQAFPHLVMHPDLAFRGFDGAYQDLRDAVVTILAGLCDHFVDEYTRCRGIPADIQAAMGSRHVTLSPESPATRSSEKLMRKRDRSYNGVQYRCEWHAKVESHRNRIHFSLPAAELGGRILIGVFVNHLDT